MSGGRRAHLARRIAKATVQTRVIWIAMPDFAIPPSVKEKCVPGINWIDGRCYAKHESGLVISVIAGGTATAPPKEDVEIEAKRLLNEAVAERYRLERQTIQKLRDELIRQGQDPDEVIRRAHERQAEQ